MFILNKVRSKINYYISNTPNAINNNIGKALHR